MVIGNTGGTRFGVESFGEGIAYGMDAAARPHPGFENGYIVPGLCELVSGRQSGQSRPDDENPLRSAPTFQSSWTTHEGVKRWSGEGCRGQGRSLQEVSAMHSLDP